MRFWVIRRVDAMSARWLPASSNAMASLNCIKCIELHRSNGVYCNNYTPLEVIASMFIAWLQFNFNTFTRRSEHILWLESMAGAQTI